MMQEQDAARGQRLADEAIERVTMSHAEWAVAAQRVVQRRSRVVHEFTTDHVWKWLEDDGVPGPREPRALGAVMRAVAGDGWIKATTDYTPSCRPGCHGRPVRIWQTIRSKADE